MLWDLEPCQIAIRSLHVLSLQREDTLVLFSAMLYECVTQECPEMLPTYIAIEQVTQTHRLCEKEATLPCQYILAIVKQLNNQVTVTQTFQKRNSMKWNTSVCQIGLSFKLLSEMNWKNIYLKVRKFIYKHIIFFESRLSKI